MKQEISLHCFTTSAKHLSANSLVAVCLVDANYLYNYKAKYEIEKLSILFHKVTIETYGLLFFGLDFVSMHYCNFFQIFLLDENET